MEVSAPFRNQHPLLVYLLLAYLLPTGPTHFPLLAASFKEKAGEGNFLISNLWHGGRNTVLGSWRDADSRFKPLGKRVLQ